MNKQQRCLLFFVFLCGYLVGRLYGATHGCNVALALLTRLSGRPYTEEDILGT